jgi:hypothetical protein
MSRTQGRSDSDTPYSDGQIFFSPSDFIYIGTAGTHTRAAQGNIYDLLAASTTYQLEIPLSGIIFRNGVQDDLQEFYGSGAGAAGAVGNAVFGANAQASPGFQTFTTAALTAGTTTISVITGTGLGFVKGQVIMVDTAASGVQEKTTITATPTSTSIVVKGIANAHASGAVISSAGFTTPAGVTGRPPFAGTTSLSPVVAPRPKGLQINSLIFNYAVVNGSSALTTNTAGVTATQFVNGAAPTITTLLTTAQNGLQTAAVGTAGFVYTTPVLISSPAFTVTPNTEVIVEWNVVTPAASTVAIYGVTANVTFNYN